MNVIFVWLLVTAVCDGGIPYYENVFSSESACKKVAIALGYPDATCVRAEVKP
jgi:hypothetical protein